MHMLAPMYMELQLLKFSLLDFSCQVMLVRSRESIGAFRRPSLPVHSLKSIFGGYSKLLSCFPTMLEVDRAPTSTLLAPIGKSVVLDKANELYQPDHFGQVRMF